MTTAIIDLGTNTVILLVAKIRPDKSFEVLHDESRIVRLGEGLIETENFCIGAMERALAAITDYKKIIADLVCEQVILVGTAGFRAAKNAAVLTEEIQNKFNWRVQIISGEEEARLIHLACATDFKHVKPPTLTLDIGGGSTEFIFDDGKEVAATSLAFGVVKLTERFLKSDPPKKSECAALTKFVLTELTTNFPGHEQASKTQRAGAKRRPNLIATAGTPTTLSAIKQKLIQYDAEKVHGSIVTKSELAHIMKELVPLKLTERAKFPCLPEKRADVIVAGMLILKAVMDYFDLDRFYVSDRGLRYGVLYDEISSPHSTASGGDC